MECNLTEPDLVPYHFGMLEGDGRTRVESHLLECPRCLREYIAIKREIETSDESPSPVARARLRAAVVREVRRSRVVWSWWERPLAAAFAGAVILMAGFAVHSLASAGGTAPRALAGSESPR
jgi:anti-sigma factor RsiW